ncbi:MAG: TonB family protein [Terriglobia bacterium]
MPTPSFEPIKVVSATEAAYPISSVGNGTLVLRVTIGASGKLENVKVIYGIPSLTQGAEKAVREWKYEPAMLDGKPVTTSITAPFTYNTWPLANVFGTVRPQEKTEGQSAGFFTPIKVLTQAAPVYPLFSHGAGTVVLQVMVDETGAITSVKPLHDIPSLTGPAEAAVRKWTFKPATLGGKPVATSMVASFAFRVPSSHEYR